MGSSITRDVEGTVYTRAGLEIGVAATKSFTTQLVAVTLVALKLALAKQTIARDAAAALLTALEDVPGQMEDLLADGEGIRGVAERFTEACSCLYLGRGLQYPLALEGALKLKEVSYLHDDRV